MQKIFTNIQYAENLRTIVGSTPSVYGWGAFGAPASYGNNKIRYGVPNAPDNCIIWDCSGFSYKAIPWGWIGDFNRVYGGAEYKKKGFEELETNNILALCTDVSTDFNKIMVGEILYMKGATCGHVGLYLGNGQAAECTSDFGGGLKITEVKNCGINTGLPYKRTWLKHGKLPFLDYVSNVNPEPADNTTLELQKIAEIRKSLDELETLIRG